MTARRLDALRLAAMALTAVGVGIAGYLTYVHYAGVTPVCEISHGCEKVQHSAYSKLGPAPVALLGLIGDAVLLAALLRDGEEGRLVAVAAAWIGFGFSAYLTFREVFTIEAVCIWCVGSALVLTGVTVLVTVRFLRYPT